MKMKTRKEVAEYINSGKLMKDNNMNKSCWHIGLIDLRNLMDFIYDNKDVKDDELINKID